MSLPKMVAIIVYTLENDNSNVGWNLTFNNYHLYMAINLVKMHHSGLYLVVMPLL